MKSGLTISELVRTAWASAASFRKTDMRGGANGARLRLRPQRAWDVNNPTELAKVLKKLTAIQKEFNNKQSSNKKISLADMIILAGSAAIEHSANQNGSKVKVPFKPGRVDASQKQTDIKSFAVLEPKADGFRNYFKKTNKQSPTSMLIEKANMLGLTVPEMTVLVGGMRALNANSNGSEHGVLTDRPGILSNDFFVNLLDMNTEWKKHTKSGHIYVGQDRKTGEKKWTATPVDLIFGSNSELRAVSEVYASNDGQKQFERDFIKAWTKVMRLDRFDLN